MADINSFMRQLAIPVPHALNSPALPYDPPALVMSVHRRLSVE